MYVVGGAVVVEVTVLVGSGTVDAGCIVEVVVVVVVLAALLAVLADCGARRLGLEHATAKTHMIARATRVARLAVQPIVKASRRGHPPA